MEASSVLWFAPFRLELGHEQLWREDQPIPLRPKTFAVLRHLVMHPGQLVTQAELLDTVWAGTIVTDVVLRSCIRELRIVLGDDAQRPRYIATVHRRGYRFIAPLSPTPPVASIQDSVVSSQYSVARREAEDRQPAARSPQDFQSITPNTQHPAPRLVGRTAELAHLHERLARALSGERQVVFVTGEPGIGKTTLVDAFLRRLSGQDLWIGHGHCIEQYGAGEAYMPLLEALGHLCRAPGGERLITLLDQHAPTWLIQMPTLLSAVHLETLQRKVQGATRERMLREMGDAVSALTAEQPLVLWLEDLHWSDVSTLDLVSLLARRREPARLLVLGSYRLADVVVKAHPLPEVQRELQLHELCERLPLDLLTEASVAEYLVARAPLVPSSLAGEACLEPSRRSRNVGVLPRRADAVTLQHLAHVIHERTEGNPLFMATLVEHLLREGAIEVVDGQWQMREEMTRLASLVPESLRQWIAQQVERLSEGEQRLLEVASVVGQDFAVAAVAAGLAQPMEAVDTACAELTRNGRFIGAAGVQEWPDGTLGGRYTFRHALYRDVLYERVSDTRRILLHQRIGERKEAAYGVQAGAVAA